MGSSTRAPPRAAGQTYGYRNQGMRIEPIIQRLSELNIDRTGAPAGVPGLP